MLDSGDQSFKTNICNGIYTKATNIKMPIKRGRNVKNANANTTGTFSSLSENEAKLSIQQREEDVADFTNAVTKTITSGMRDILRRKKLPGNPYNSILPKIRYKEIEENVKQLGLDGHFNSKQCLPSGKNEGFITQIKNEDDANCFGIESVLKFINATRMGELMDNLSLMKGMWMNSPSLIVFRAQQCS